MDTLRGVAVLLVVFSHAVHLSPVDPPRVVLALDFATTPFRIPALMFLSGMLLPTSLAKPRATYLRGKVSRILWPYLLWSLVVLAGPLDPLAVDHAPSLHRLFCCFFCFLCGDLLTRHAGPWLPVLVRRRTIVACALLALPAVVMAVAGFTVRFQALYLVSTLAGIVATLPLLMRFGGTVPGRFVAAQGRSSIVFYVTHWPVQLVAYHLAYGVGLRNGLAITTFNLAAGLGAGFAMLWLRSRLPALDLLYDLHLERWRTRADRPTSPVPELAER